MHRWKWFILYNVMITVAISTSGDDPLHSPRIHYVVSDDNKPNGGISTQASSKEFDPLQGDEKPEDKKPDSGKG